MIYSYYDNNCARCVKENAKTVASLLKNHLKRAVQDIQQYVDELQISGDLFSFRERKLEYDEHKRLKDLAPNIDCYHSWE